MDALTIDQFAVFAAIAEEGSFAAAARRMNRAQSAITYAIQKLEDQSGLELFDRSSYRPVLTEAGKALLPRAQRILAELEQYRLHARRMTMGIEHELRLAVHPFVSPQLLAKVLFDFEEKFPSVHLHAWTESKAIAVDALPRREVDLALMPELVSLGAGFEHTFCSEIQLVVAAAPNHPLAQLDGGAFPAALLRDHRQLVMYMKIADEDLNVMRGYGMDVINIWRVMDFELQRVLLLAGAGWSALPRARIEDDVVAGRLVVLRPRGWGNAEQVLKLPFFVVRATNNPPGPAARWLFDCFAKNAVV
ncbi:MAG TPA: LysR family transcriptional regulator [Rhizomicrobium sp.]|jgi:DNA-binding transcriptional LysR family regulator|nr:LysR family transcriptional regulator [Rhizomicrobium sp.]